MKHIQFILLVTLLMACNAKPDKSASIKETDVPKLTLEQANRLASLPLKCMQKEFPNKPGQSLSMVDDIGTPKELHPAFYGCYDWHSSVHGHWMLVRLLKTFPKLQNREEIIEELQQNISAENIKMELAYFKRPSEKSFERTYGWAWLLKLAEELHTWDSTVAKELEQNLQPLTDYIVFKYLDFLPRLHYPVRVGEHPNTAFGMSFAWDYANTIGSSALKDMIEKRAIDFYFNDNNCPLSWEPGGYDFLSPCLQEADIMRKVLPAEEYKIWLRNFLPQLSNPEYHLAPGIVSDRSDGKLVHLDGVNFSRAWCLYGIAKNVEGYEHLKQWATEHIAYSLPNITDGDYMGEHWLASFAIYALMEGE